jgi:hypothetical protein
MRSDEAGRHEKKYTCSIFHMLISAGGSPVPCGWEMECQGALQVLQVMSMVCPNQADSLQGSRGVNYDILAANDLGIGSGWQQSKQN